MLRSNGRAGCWRRSLLSLPDSEDKIDDHEARIRKLEMRMGWAVGGFGLVAAVMPWIVGALG
jgi:hypothetical protein